MYMTMDKPVIIGVKGRFSFHLRPEDQEYAWPDVLAKASEAALDWAEPVYIIVDGTDKFELSFKRKA